MREFLIYKMINDTFSSLTHINKNIFDGQLSQRRSFAEQLCLRAASIEMGPKSLWGPVLSACAPLSVHNCMKSWWHQESGPLKEVQVIGVQSSCLTLMPLETRPKRPLSLPPCENVPRRCHLFNSAGDFTYLRLSTLQNWEK